MSGTTSRNTETIRLSSVLAPIAERWRVVVLVPLLFTLATVAFSLTRQRKFMAELTMTTVSTTRSGSLTQSFPASLLAGMSSGLQPTPALVTRLARSRNVMSEIARTVVPGREQTVIELVDEDLGPNSPDYKLYQAILEIIEVGHDRETGLVTLTVTNTDSALARFVTGKLVDELTTAFQNAARAQAKQIRESQELRVDSASRRLRHAEQRLVEFLGQNRIIAPHSLAAVERDRLARDVSVAQEVYMQAVTERESAVAKELEETPAVVVVDPVPRELVPVARRTVLKGLLTALVSFLLTTVVVVILDMLRRGGSTPERDRARLAAAAGQLPRFGLSRPGDVEAGR